MSTYTTSLKIQEINTGDQSGTWGNTTNTNWTLIEQAVAGVQTISMGNADYTLTNLNGVLDEARNMILVVQGTNSAIRKVIAPQNQPKMYVVYNNTTGGYAITIGSPSGSIVTIPNGVTAQVYTDGTNFFSAQTGSAGDFVVNGNFSATGSESVTGNLSVGGTLSVTGASTFSTIPTSPTASPNDNSTKVATTAYVATAISATNSVLTGSIQMWPTTSAPSGYLNCNGTAVSRTTYAALFGIIGTTFGSGDGSSTFNLPNYSGRMPYGTTIGSTGGSADAIVVSHTHTATSNVTDPGHHHEEASAAGGSPNPAYSNTIIPYAGIGYIGPTGFITGNATTGITVGTSISTTGSSGSGANLPPYLGINFIIKT
jgi:microcystin-dependent protein